MGLVGIVPVSGLGTLILEFLQRGQSKEEMVSLSDRLTWWSAGLDLLSQHPWTGLGAFAGGTFGVFEKLGLNNVGPLHSDYIETMVGTSFWGLIPLLVALLGCWWVLLAWMREKNAPPGDRQLAMEAIAVYGDHTALRLHDVYRHAPTFEFHGDPGVCRKLEAQAEGASQAAAICSGRGGRLTRLGG